MTIYVYSEEDIKGVRDLSPNLLGEDRRLRIMPADYYAETQPIERMLFCARHGVYGLHTVELIGWLREFIGDRSAIDIGAGNGVLAEALQIRATDNRMQEWKQVRDWYIKANEQFHAQHPLIALAHERIYAPWLYSRALKGRDFIGIWRGKKQIAR